MGRAPNDAGHCLAPQRQYHMQTTRDEGPAGKWPGEPAGPRRPGQSGEGARTALEQLIREDRKRQAQLPRDAQLEPGAPQAPPG